MLRLAAILATSLWASTPDTPDLFRAIERNDPDAVRAILLKAPLAPNPFGVTPLGYACELGHLEVAKILVEQKQPIEQLGPGGETPLMLAARNGNAALVELLLAQGANPNTTTPTGQTALMWAAAEGHAAVVEQLLAAGAQRDAKLKAGFNAWFFAVREGRIAVVESLLRAGVDINQKFAAAPNAPRRGRAPRPGSAALLLATVNGHFELAARLLDLGADPNAIDAGWTALHAITGVRKPGGGDNDPPPVGSGNLSSLDLVRKLKEKGADLNARMTKKINVGLTSLNTIGATAFILAAKSADAPMLRLLAELGADPHIPTADGANAFIVGAGLGTRSPGEDAGTEAEVAEALAVIHAQKVDINAVDQNGETAMHGAAYRNSPAAVRFLASHGADPKIWNTKNKQGWTPLRIAEGYRFGNFKPSPVTVEAIRVLLP
jgi:ankyrin repeat protein